MCVPVGRREAGLTLARVFSAFFFLSRKHPPSFFVFFSFSFCSFKCFGERHATMIILFRARVVRCQFSYCLSAGSFSLLGLVSVFLFQCLRSSATSSLVLHPNLFALSEGGRPLPGKCRKVEALLLAVLFFGLFRHLGFYLYFRQQP